jgi:hypothetical protein
VQCSVSPPTVAALKMLRYSFGMGSLYLSRISLFSISRFFEPSLMISRLI